MYLLFQIEWHAEGKLRKSSFILVNIIDLKVQFMTGWLNKARALFINYFVGHGVVQTQVYNRSIHNNAKMDFKKHVG